MDLKLTIDIMVLHFFFFFGSLGKSLPDPFSVRKLQCWQSKVNYWIMLLLCTAELSAMPFNNSINWKVMASVRKREEGDVAEEEEILHKGGSMEVESCSVHIF